MDRWELPVGLATGNDIFARLFTEMAHERGWQIPRDMAIISCLNEASLCEKPRPALTSVEIGYERIGYEAARLLETLMDETAATKGKASAATRSRGARRSEKPRHVIIPPVGVVVRESTDFFGSSDEFVTQAQTYIAQHCHEHLEVRDVAEHFEVSTKTLQTRFAAVLKHTVAEEICRIRLEKAKRELVSGRRPINDIAMRAGFGSNAQMCAVFRREVGISPRQYRKERAVPHGRQRS
jgi:LacI family transcriptional regulator